jgi:hypothetical protein
MMGIFRNEVTQIVQDSNRVKIPYTFQGVSCLLLH